MWTLRDDVAQQLVLSKYKFLSLNHSSLSAGRFLLVYTAAYLMVLSTLLD